MRRYGPIALALLLDLVGAGGALLLGLRPWQTITATRPAPLGDLVVSASGRTVDSAPTALALVALAGVVAVLATRGLSRRIVGAILFLAGAGLVWRAIAAAGAVSESRARTLVTDKHSAVSAVDITPHVATHPIWPMLTVVCGLFVLAAGAFVAARGHQWQGMSARYERTPDAEQAQARAATALWTALDRGDDPT